MRFAGGKWFLSRQGCLLGLVFIAELALMLFILLRVNGSYRVILLLGASCWTLWITRTLRTSWNCAPSLLDLLLFINARIRIKNNWWAILIPHFIGVICWAICIVYMYFWLILMSSWFRKWFHFNIKLIYLSNVQFEFSASILAFLSESWLVYEMILLLFILFNKALCSLDLFHYQISIDIITYLDMPFSTRSHIVFRIIKVILLMVLLIPINKNLIKIY